MRKSNLLIMLFFSLILFSCDQSRVDNSFAPNANNDSVAKANKKISDSVVSADQLAKKSDSIERLQDNKKQNSSGLTIEQLIGGSLNIEEDQNTTYSKNFVPTISFSAKNNSGKTIDLFCLSIKMQGVSNPIEKKIDKTIKSGSKASIKFSLNSSGTVLNYSVTKIHFIDGTIENVYQPSPYSQGYQH